MHLYAEFKHETAVLSQEVRSVTNTVRLRVESTVSNEKAVQLMKEALLKQTGVTIDESEAGKAVARLAKPTK